jgi:hypothetical protein
MFFDSLLELLFRDRLKICARYSAAHPDRKRAQGWGFLSILRWQSTGLRFDAQGLLNGWSCSDEDEPRDYEGGGYGSGDLVQAVGGGG